MVGSPPPLANGYAWFAHTLMTAEGAATLERQLGALRHELRTRDVTGLGAPRFQAEVELWVHADDMAAARAILRPLLAAD